MNRISEKGPRCLSFLSPSGERKILKEGIHKRSHQVIYPLHTGVGEAETGEIRREQPLVTSQEIFTSPEGIVLRMCNIYRALPKT